MDFANTLKDLRELNGVTQKQLAEFLKVSRPTIAGYETRNRQPDFERLEKIAHYFNVSVEYLIRGVQEENIAPVKESIVDHNVSVSYQNLSLSSKKDVLEYIHLLELKEKNEK